MPLHQGVPVTEQSLLRWGCTEPLPQGSCCAGATRNTRGMQGDNRENRIHHEFFHQLGCSAPPEVPLGVPDGGRAPSSPRNSGGPGPSSPTPLPLGSPLPSKEEAVPVFFHSAGWVMLKAPSLDNRHERSGRKRL